MKQPKLVLADDDADDCIFFREILKDLPDGDGLTIVNDGVELMQWLNLQDKLPDVLFLDLNMPLKTGYECLEEIKISNKLKKIPVVIFSTSFEPGMINNLYEMGAHYYIRKPGAFSKLKEVIIEALALIKEHGNDKPPRKEFVLNQN